MKFGVCLTHYGREVESAELVEAVTEIERTGFDSIWVTDHVVIPEGVREAQLIYREHMLEAFTVFSYLAAVSERAQLGSSIIVLGYRNPLVMAKMLASIDVLSGGRVIFGAAAGYMEGEFNALGVPFEERGDVSDEYLRVIREAWSHDEMGFSGRYFNFDKVYTSPRPVQQSGPPIWIGGRSKRAMRRAVELGDGWHPIGLSAAEMKEGRAYMARLCERRKRAQVPGMSLRANLVIEGVSEPVGPYTGRAGNTPFNGAPSLIRERIAEFEEAGVEHIVLDMATLSRASFLRTLEAFAAHVRS
ncbi:MAG: LLM class F420-dependent oxidoreductase [Deltaproteobacteria bacterium]|nr:LLM class F420-dependent oxidoreductase [Deltaproteobacteria bacterium]